ncbi:hypothetical protein FZEAL_6556 [Fusarium zealandicum]|uniref:Mcm2 3 5 family protein n=1 Tax=Fusarium zealandicum TaxID=1053134 RepID=A0A8H4XJC7_9HYPO|nr:hypothetical protein FZEAL_6556 [Fusarium zealandicum]
MAGPSRPLTLPDDFQDPVSAFSPPPTSKRSATSLSAGQAAINLFRSNGGYQRMPSDGAHEMADLEDNGTSSPGLGSSGANGLGIAMRPAPAAAPSPNLSQHRQSLGRVPVGGKGSPPETPRSFHDLLGASPPSSVVSPGQPPSAPLGPVNSRAVNSQGTPEPFSEIWTPSMPLSARSSRADMSKEAEDLKNMPTAHTREIGSPSLTPGGNSTPGVLNPRGDVSDDDDEFDDETFHRKFAEPPSHCSSNQDIHQRRTSWLSITIYVLSFYSTAMSGIWLVTAIVQPRWGHGISSRRGLVPSTATTVAALVAKTIEMTFVTVFVSCLGQVLTRRAFIRKANGMTLAEMTMRNWVIQPGTLITHFETLPSSSMTLLGMLSLTATFAAAFYTTASDAMVSPKLKYGNWESKELSGYVRASYANAQYVSYDCASLFNREDDIHAAESCMNVQFSGQSYRNLLNFMTMWTNINSNGTDIVDDLSVRPTGTTLLFDNTTMYSTWIETQYGNVSAQYDESGRIINNVTLALPHPGVYSASTLGENGILQPDDLAGVGEYIVRAGVVSPSINVLCVDMDKDELAPLVYTEWPNAKVNETSVADQVKGWMGWEGEVPQPLSKSGDDVYLNRTDVDDIFQWGPKYKRRPPVFQLYPYDFNLLTNATVTGSDSIYMLGKSAANKNYTLCQLRSWVSPNCSTEFNISGTAGANMKAHCEDDADENSYRRSFEPDQGWSPPSLDWRWLADQWRLSMDLNGGAVNNNASNARILTQLALHEPKLPSSLPSMAEAIAVYSSSLVMISSIDTPFRHYWDYEAPNNFFEDGSGMLEAFNASISTQEYTSGHTNAWQNIFYVVLVLVFAINLFCLCYFIMRSGLVTDFTEPQNMFALAVNSPPSVGLNGSCGGGPQKRHLKVPWKVSYAPSANHYFFNNTSSGKEPTEGLSTAREFGVPAKMSSYKRLSRSKGGWL